MYLLAIGVRPVCWSYATAAGPDQVKPTFRLKCPSLRLSTPPPAQCTMNASRMMARIATTTQKKNTMMPGTAYPATVLALATATSYPPPPDLFSGVNLGIQHGRDEGVPEHMRMRPGNRDPSGLGQPAQAAGGGMAVHPGAAAVEQDRPADAVPIARSIARPGSGEQGLELQVGEPQGR